MRARWTVIGACVASALLAALPAAAEETTTELDSADRALIHSYDPESMQLLWSTFDGNADVAAAECDLTDGTEYDYTIDAEGNVTVTGDEGESTCEFNATDVTGPEGQVNHGTVVSAFVKALQEADLEHGIGCYVRIIAQSDYGKGDQQVNVEDVDPDAGTTETVEGTSEFTISETTCGKPDHAGPPEDAGKPEGAGAPEGTGKPSWAGEGKPDHAGSAGKGGGGRP